MTRCATETSSIEDFGELRAAEYRSAPLAPLSDKERVRHLVRVRLLTSPGCPVWDISYVWATGREGPVRVVMPDWQLPREGMMRALVKMFESQKRYAKIMDLWAPDVLSKVW